ncbi:vascular endothelial growth factor B [Platysternon megacephalum]|uniref:Vascular endothelial growth factor B n=1 Tax=Platysternon megacephalum TaxID=55544 RepID=A0A4D9EZJ0_9SAUR|nr:vascular endothelial growth factor B [Platysternon megacephalum]
MDRTHSPAHPIPKTPQTVPVYPTQSSCPAHSGSHFKLGDQGHPLPVTDQHQATCGIHSCHPLASPIICVTGVRGTSSTLAESPPCWSCCGRCSAGSFSQ